MGGKEPKRTEKFMDNREMLKMYASAIPNSNLKWDVVKMGQLVKSYFQKIKISVLYEKNRLSGKHHNDNNNHS